jgi:UDP-N-acetyl-D-mannosaminuronic acid transferase (WecB/TagA/CpsF family)
MPGEFRQILGIRFYVGGLEGLLNRVAGGGLIVVPSAPVLANLPFDPAHRAALLGSDFAITDSGYMILLWAVLKGERLRRISGLRLLRGLLGRPEFRAAGATFWVMPSAADARTNLAWLDRQGVAAGPEACYEAPLYPPGALEDEALLAAIEARRPRYVVLGVGGGVQERLGYFLRQRLSYRPAILCTGAAIAFLSGQQVRIPVWADRLVLGWLFRILSDPVTFVPRFWRSIRLAGLLWRYGEQAPPPA